MGVATCVAFSLPLWMTEVAWGLQSHHGVSGGPSRGHWPPPGLPDALQASAGRKRGVTEGSAQLPDPVFPQPPLLPRGTFSF